MRNIKIRKLQLDGFKNISNTTLELNQFNALIALNNFGKTNFFEGLEFAQDFIHSDKDEKHTLMGVQSYVPINSYTADRNFKFEIEFETKFNDTSYIALYSFSFEWINNSNTGRRISEESLKVKEIKKGEKFSSFIIRNNERKNFLSSLNGRCDRKIEVDDCELILNKLASKDSLFYINLVHTILELNITVLEIENIERYFQPQTQAFVDNDGSLHESRTPSIAQFLYKFKEKDSETYELLVSTILELLPSLESFEPIEINFASGDLKQEDIPFKIPELVYDIRVKEKYNNQPTSINNLSYGSKRVIHIITMALLAQMKDDDIVCFEEIENCVHPALFQKLLMIISELAQDVQILITSHSPYMIKFLDLDDIYLGLSNKKGVADFKKIKKSKQNKLFKYIEDIEGNLGDTVFDILIDGIGDEEEENQWTEYFA
jgi:predicted ATP-dependent endonuclease of OLD family